MLNLPDDVQQHIFSFFTANEIFIGIALTTNHLSAIAKHWITNDAKETSVVGVFDASRPLPPPTTYKFSTISISNLRIGLLIQKKQTESQIETIRTLRLLADSRKLVELALHFQSTYWAIPMDIVALFNLRTLKTLRLTESYLCEDELARVCGYNTFCALETLEIGLADTNLVLSHARFPSLKSLIIKRTRHKSLVLVLFTSIATLSSLTHLDCSDMWDSGQLHALLHGSYSSTLRELSLSTNLALMDVHAEFEGMSQFPLVSALVIIYQAYCEGMLGSGQRYYADCVPAAQAT